MSAEESPKKKGGRYNTKPEVKQMVWVKMAGHCELCGTDLTHDFRVGTSMQWAEVAHILPASPKGPRGREEHSDEQAKNLTNDFSNLMLLCPNCHEKIDRDDEGYPEDDLSGLHESCLARIRLAASQPAEGRAIALIVQSQHLASTSNIPAGELLTAMSSEGLTAFGSPINVTFREPGSRGRDDIYWQLIKDDIDQKISGELARRGGNFGDMPALALVGLADIPALIMLGQAIGDRSNRYLFSRSRTHGLHWPSKAASPPDYIFAAAPSGDGPLALVLSISATIPERDIEAALPGARIASLTIPEPSYAMVSNRNVINAFRDELQKHLSQLEASTDQPINLFAAIPAALAIEFGALLTTQHQHPYVIFDRDNSDQFRPMLTIGHPQEPQK
ncbi:SAVED domain-containing protein [Nissabacter sp. SGAir0207]|uniref:SAVED domain-containing protein n=1 Tax=Nissabacter sp. SGAir0207 TaxID=2126321 RepID=UPI0010CCE124|nr:HNH endonuclease [Nissabacter sp. SGAir0207]